MITSFVITLLGGIVGLLFAQNQDLKKELNRMYKIERDIHRKTYENNAKAYEINDAIKEADENERWY